MADLKTRSYWRRSVAAWLIRWRIALVAVASVIFVVAFPASRRLEFDRTTTAMFSPEDKTFQDYMELRQYFGSNTVVMFVYQDDDLMTPEGLKRNKTIAERIGGVPVQDGAVKNPGGLNSNETIQKTEGGIPGVVGVLSTSLLGGQFEKLFSGYTHSDDRTYASIVTILSLDAPPESLDELEALAEEVSGGILKSISKQPAYIIGEPILIQYGFKSIEEDGLRLATLTIALLSVVVIVSLGSMRFVVLTGILIGWSVVVTRAIMVWSNVNLSLISSILTAIVTVIAVATILHLGIRFRALLARGYTTQKAAQTSIARLLVPIMVACFNEAAGFAALRASAILPVQQFGFSIAIAAMVVLLGVLFWTPALMTFSDVESVRNASPLIKFRVVEKWLSRVLRRATRGLGMAAIDHRWVCFAVAAICMVFTVIGLRRAKSETSFLNNFRSDNEIVISYSDFEKNFGGAGVWDIVLEAPSQLTPEYLVEVRKLETELLTLDAGGAKLTKLMSLAAVDDVFAANPLTSWMSSSARLALMGSSMPAMFDAFVTKPADGKRRYRIMLRSREQNESEARNELIAQVQQKVAQTTASESWKKAFENSRGGPPEGAGAVTGYYVLTSRLVASLVGDQWRSFSVAAVLVWICILIFTRSVPLAFAALIANLLPTAFVLSFPGLMGERINMGATIIAAVSIGLSIDGSVHFLAAFRRLRDRGHGVRRSAIHAAGSIGVPLMWATVALVIGFAALSTSEFVPIATFGAMVSATLAVGTLVNLTLLPVLVCAWSRE
jgi:predicted RND superfamily exporter protein